MDDKRVSTLETSASVLAGERLSTFLHLSEGWTFHHTNFSHPFRNFLAVLWILNDRLAKVSKHAILVLVMIGCGHSFEQPSLVLLLFLQTIPTDRVQ